MALTIKVTVGNIFFDPEVWGDEFTEIGILILPRQTLLRSIVASNSRIITFVTPYFSENWLAAKHRISFFYPEIYELANGTLGHNWTG